MELSTTNRQAFDFSYVRMCIEVVMMIKKWQQILLVFILCIGFPSILASFLPKNEKLNVGQAIVQDSQNAVEETENEVNEMKIPVLINGKTKMMEMNKYIVCVVLQEMPASFDIEALKAQAVVARTYALKRNLSSKKHKNGAVCSDSGCCQGYISVSAYLKKGGKEAFVEKVEKAVNDTEYKVLTYNDKLIDATYFSCSGGKTEDAQAVWGNDVPYLQSVESPGEEHATHYVDTVTFTPQQFQNKLGVKLSGNPGTWLKDVSYTQGGGVDEMVLCGKTFTGTALRTKLGLRSTAFILTAVGNTITVTTKGFGHRVGMSQYGADAMAANGKTCAEILSHYYPGTSLADYPVE